MSIVYAPLSLDRIENETIAVVAVVEAPTATILGGWRHWSGAPPAPGASANAPTAAAPRATPAAAIPNRARLIPSPTPPTEASPYTSGRRDVSQPHRKPP